MRFVVLYINIYKIISMKKFSQVQTVAHGMLVQLLLSVSILLKMNTSTLRSLLFASKALIVFVPLELHFGTLH